MGPGNDAEWVLPEAAAAVIDELKQAVTRACATHGAAVSGLRRFAPDLARLPRLPTNPHPTISFTDGDPNLAATRHAGRLHFSEFASMAERGGLAEQQLGHQWLVYVFTIWETEYRAKIASSLGVPPSQIDVPIFGDLRHIRNDVVHNRGTASARETGKCTALTWFVAGDVIVIEHKHVAELEEMVRGLAFRPSPES